MKIEKIKKILKAQLGITSPDPQMWTDIQEVLYTNNYLRSRNIPDEEMSQISVAIKDAVISRLFYLILDDEIVIRGVMKKRSEWKAYARDIAERLKEDQI